MSSARRAARKKFCLIVPTASLLVSELEPNAGLQLRRAISIQAERKRLLEKHAIAPSAARLCCAALCGIRAFFQQVVSAHPFGLNINHIIYVVIETKPNFFLLSFRLNTNIASRKELP